MSTEDWRTIITALAAAFIAIMQVWQHWRSQQNATKLDEQGAKLQAQGIKQDVQGVKQDEQGKKLELVHVLVNSQMGVQKRTLAETTAAKAAITHSPADEAAADAALKDYIEHEQKQKAADRI